MFTKFISITLFAKVQQFFVFTKYSPFFLLPKARKAVGNGLTIFYWLLSCKMLKFGFVYCI